MMKEIKMQHIITDRDSRSIDRYLNEIGKVNLITAEEEVLLAQKIRQGDQAALQKLTKANLRFVVSVAKQYQKQGLTLGDLINEGNIGLIKAAQRFDETKGFKFISYAVWWIRQTILVAISEQVRIIRLPANQVAASGKVNKIVSQLEQQHEREPSKEEIAEAMEITIDKVSDILMHSQREKYLDAPFNYKSDTSGMREENTLLDMLPSTEHLPDQALIIESIDNRIMAAVGKLKPRNREVIIDFFGLAGRTPMSLEEIAEKINLTRERARQIKETSVAKLRTIVKGTDLELFF